MLANLMPPPPRVTVDVPGTDGRVEVHPRCRRLGLRSATDFLNLPGVVVGGHPDRHVARVTLGDGRTAYLKREHIVPLPVRLRNAAAGFGFVSRSEREAKVLQALEAVGLPGPALLAHGTTPDGRAFLLTEAVADAVDLRSLVSDNAMSLADWTEVIRAIAAVHAARITTPDLSAKHVLLRDGDSPCLLDWANARIGNPVTVTERAAALAGLFATLPDDVPRADLIDTYANLAGVERAPLTVAIDARLDRRKSRSSVREQRQQPAAPVEWVWLDGESLVVRPELADRWPVADVYQETEDEPSVLRLVNGSRCEVHRFHDTRVRPQLWERLTGRVWRSTGVRVARIAAHLERHGLPVSRAMAFGQKRTPTGGESFVALEHADATPLWVWLPSAAADQQRRVVFELGAWLRSAHAASCRVSPTAVRITDTAVPRVCLNSLSVAKFPVVSTADVITDLRQLVAAVPGRTNRLRFIAGYVAGGESPFTVRQLARRLNVTRRAA